jgi:hypothetical protein
LGCRPAKRGRTKRLRDRTDQLTKDDRRNPACPLRPGPTGRDYRSQLRLIFATSAERQHARRPRSHGLRTINPRLGFILVSLSGFISLSYRFHLGVS